MSYVGNPPESIDTTWLIDIGAFYDRFGAAKMAVLTSTNPTVIAILKDVQVRKWIDLKRDDVAQALTALSAIITAITPAMVETILSTPAAPLENLALRKQYFS